MEDFADKDWIDAILLGPWDMALNLGHCNQLDHPEVVSAISRVIYQVAEIGKPCGMPVASVEAATSGGNGVADFSSIRS